MIDAGLLVFFDVACIAISAAGFQTAQTGKFGCFGAIDCIVAVHGACVAVTVPGHDFVLLTKLDLSAVVDAGRLEVIFAFMRGCVVFSWLFGAVHDAVRIDITCVFACPYCLAPFGAADDGMHFVCRAVAIADSIFAWIVFAEWGCAAAIDTDCAGRACEFLREISVLAGCIGR